MADLGIEFKQKNETVEEERYPERVDKPTFHNPEKKVSAPIKKIPIFSTIKKVFTKSPSVEKTAPVKAARDNSALKEVLNKALSLNKPSTPVPKVNQPIPNIPIPTPSPVSLNTLKTENKNSKDRSASHEDMDKLKNLIKTADISTKKEDVKASPVGVQPREVPEDVLRKILK